MMVVGRSGEKFDITRRENPLSKEKNRQYMGLEEPRTLNTARLMMPGAGNNEYLDTTKD
jgi:hypothetical protein